jgi:hypothetical protein
MKRLVLAMLLGGLAIGLGCSHEAKPVMAPDDHPPLPPASPVGYLVDDSSELKLSDVQLGKLREIDDALGTRLASYESEMRNGEPVPSNSAPAKPSTNFGGGVSNTQTNGQAGQNPVNGTSSATVPTSTTKTYVVTGETVTRIRRARASDTREAIGRALELLDATQRVIARRVLTDHGVNPDTGVVTEAAGVPGATPSDNPLAPIKQGEP